MLTIRLARFGKKKQPFYRIVVNEKKHPPKGNVVEYLGTLNPKSKELKYDKQRIEYWLSKGASYSRTIGMMLVKEKLIKKEDLPALFLVEKKRKKKKEQPEAEKPAVSVAPAPTEAESKVEEPKPAETEVKAEVKTVEKQVEETPKTEEKAVAPEEKKE